MQLEIDKCEMLVLLRGIITKFKEKAHPDNTVTIAIEEGALPDGTVIKAMEEGKSNSFDNLQLTTNNELQIIKFAVLL